MDNLDLLLKKKHHDPHSFLGCHDDVIRIFRPTYDEVFLQLKDKKIKADKIDPKGLFEYRLKDRINKLDYQIYLSDQAIIDPYIFDPILTKKDIERFKGGVHYELYDVMGAHPYEIDGIKGVRFCVWAPNAIGVSVFGDFNDFDGQVFQMRNVYNSGVWEIFIPSIEIGSLYKFEITTKDEKILTKTDPFSFSNELRPHNSSFVCDIDAFKFDDDRYKEKRKNFSLSTPINIYEVHLGSWKDGTSYYYNYKELAHMLAPYLKKMGYNYIELLPIMEHPLDDSWGYQVSGFYAITSRHGSVSDFQYFVNYMHNNDIGVILDWVPAHFPVDDFSLHRFDGSYLYEHEDPKRGFHPQWNTSIFDYGKLEVNNFLISSALYYFDKMHIDGLRVDAVTSMLQLDYERKEGQWIPNKYGGNENLEAIEFLKHLNKIIHIKFPFAMTIAEEATSFKGITDKKNLGFDLKWNMGWMNDTLHYFKTKPEYRNKRQNDLTFSMMYFYNENFLLPLSHDEVVHEKGSLFNKMPELDDFSKLANLRLLYSYMICHPGKKLTFMGNEIAQKSEWNYRSEVSWELLEDPMHEKFQKCISDLNQLYYEKDAFWEKDFSYDGFNWVDFSDSSNCIISYLRKSDSLSLFCIHNFSQNDLNNYFLKLKVKNIKELFNTDFEKYGGKISEACKYHIQEDGIIINIASFSSLIFEVEID